MTEHLNEEILIVRKQLKPTTKKIVSENLGNLYANGASNPYSAVDADPQIHQNIISLKLDPSIDSHTIEIQQGSNAVKVANDKFVLMTKSSLATLFAELERLKKNCLENHRTINQLKSKIESLSKLNSKIEELRNRNMNSNFKDGGSF